MVLKLIWQGRGSQVGRPTLLNAFLPNLAVQVQSLRPETILPVDWYTIIWALSTNVLSFWSQQQTSKVLRPRLVGICQHLGKHFFCGSFHQQQVSAGAHFAMTTYKYTHGKRKHYQLMLVWLVKSKKSMQTVIIKPCGRPGILHTDT